MTIKDLINKVKNVGIVEPEDEENPREIRDKYLESLRRERQVQLNELEKRELKRSIAEYKKIKLRENLYGIKEDREDEKSYLGDSHRDRKVNVMSDEINVLKQKAFKQKKLLTKRSLLNNRVEEFKKKKQKNILY